MARKLRIEYSGAVYHVISRGNYRADVFAHEGTRTAFLKCLAEACAKSGWVVWCEERAQFCLKALTKTERQVLDDPKGAPWKVAITTVLKTTTTASNPWIARRLNMGSPFRMCRLVSDCRATPAKHPLFVKLSAVCKV